MKIDIWSDVICPFCYIGKRKFELALNRFSGKDQVQIEWHSFELDPSSKTDPGQNVYDYLAERKGQSREWSVQMHENVTAAAAQVGLEYNFDKAVIANTFDAHRLIQMAKEHGLGDAAEERLFRAYFTEGRNIGDHSALAVLGSEIGLDGPKVKEMLSEDAFGEQVRNDETNASILGIRGVPFFVINQKYGVSGAQSPEVFLQALEMAWKEFAKENKTIKNISGDGQDACSIEEGC